MPVSFNTHSQTLTWKIDAVPDKPATKATVLEGWNSTHFMIGPSFLVSLFKEVRRFTFKMFLGKYDGLIIKFPALYKIC